MNAKRYVSTPARALPSIGSQSTLMLRAGFYQLTIPERLYILEWSPTIIWIEIAWVSTEFNIAILLNISCLLNK